MGNHCICRLLTFSVTLLPNVMKFRQCFLELQLKCPGCLFSDAVCTCVIAERMSTQDATVILTFMMLPAALFGIICLACIVKTIVFYAGGKYRRSKIVYRFDFTGLFTGSPSCLVQLMPASQSLATASTATIHWGMSRRHQVSTPS